MSVVSLGMVQAIFEHETSYIYSFKLCVFNRIIKVTFGVVTSLFKKHKSDNCLK